MKEHLSRGLVVLYRSALAQCIRSPLSFYPCISFVGKPKSSSITWTDTLAAVALLCVKYASYRKDTKDVFTLIHTFVETVANSVDLILDRPSHTLHVSLRCKCKIEWSNGDVLQGVWLSETEFAYI